MINLFYIFSNSITEQDRDKFEKEVRKLEKVRIEDQSGNNILPGTMEYSRWNEHPIDGRWAYLIDDDYLYSIEGLEQNKLDKVLPSKVDSNTTDQQYTLEEIKEQGWFPDEEGV